MLLQDLVDKIENYEIFFPYSVLFIKAIQIIKIVFLRPKRIYKQYYQM